MERLRQDRQRPAFCPTGEDLAIENARNPDRRPVAGDAFDQAVTGIEGQHRLRLDGGGGSQDREADQRSAPAISFWSLE